MTLWYIWRCNSERCCSNGLEVVVFSILTRGAQNRGRHLVKHQALFVAITKLFHPERECQLTSDRHTKDAATRTLLLIPPAKQLQTSHYYHDNSRFDQEEQGEEEEEGRDIETSLPMTSPTTNTSRYFLGPRKVLRALSVPLSERTPLLFTRRDDHLSKACAHPLLRREDHVSMES